jgi:addiction module HigA family antidote
MRINDQWRVSFRWKDGNTHNVEFVDDHQEMQMKKKMPPIHPGEILAEEFLAPLGITQYRLAKDISVPARRINEIVHGQRSVTADTALRFGRYFNMSPQFWLNLQAHYDLDEAEDRIGSRLDEEVHALAVA